MLVSARIRSNGSTPAAPGAALRDLGLQGCFCPFFSWGGWGGRRGFSGSFVRVSGFQFFFFEGLEVLLRVSGFQFIRCGLGVQFCSQRFFSWLLFFRFGLVRIWGVLMV